MILARYSSVFVFDGLSHEEAVFRYRKRRQGLLRSLQDITVFFGVSESPDRQNHWSMLPTTLYQDPTFLYLTGVNQYRCALVLDPFSSSQKEILFLSPKDKEKEFWDGVRLGSGDSRAIKEVKSVTGIKTVKPIDDLFCFISMLLEDRKQSSIATFWHDAPRGKKSLKDDHYYHKQRLKTELRRLGNRTVQLSNVEGLLTSQRLCLDDVDQDHLKKANKRTADVFKETLCYLDHCSSEQDVFAYLMGRIYSLSWMGASFPLIVAGGANAAVLHYNKNNDPLPKKGLLLLDFGVRFGAMAADVSRTIPVNGRFNPLQTCLYDIVLDVQLAIEKKIRPGVTIEEINLYCWGYMEKLLNERFLSQGGKMTRPYVDQPHNVGHLLGHMVHDGDPYRSYRNDPLKVGMVITNEPGLYGTFEGVFDGVTYHETLGIRIEDNLLVTQRGCKNLTRSCPKTRFQLEALIAKKDQLQN